MTLPLARQRIHEKLPHPTELLKLHLKHYRMSTEQFKKRTSALKIPAKICEEYDQVVKQCDTCQKSKIAPSRSRISGMRSETFGELTFVDHGELAINEKSEAETIGHLLGYFETYQLNPKYLVGDQGLMGTELEAFYNRKNIRPITLGPGTPWPNRAEAPVRMYTKQIALMLKAVTEDPSRYEITYRQLLRQASLARKMVTFGGVSPLEMAFGRRPADLLYPENMAPEQLTASLPSPEKNIDALRTLAMKSYLEAKQSDDLRRDISARL